MKKLVALILVCLLCMATTAFAAEWAEGLSPAKPSNLKPAVDLNTTVGYWLPFPRSGLPAERYCDVLELYMPNPDVALGEGTATLWNADGEVAKVDFADPDQVEMRDLEEEELEIMHWGSGVCIEMHLPVSLAFGETYYVTMDEGTITSNGGKTKSMQIPYTDQLPLEEQYWTPSVTGDFGVGGLYYSAAPAEPTDEEEEAAEPAEEAPAEEGRCRELRRGPGRRRQDRHHVQRKQLRVLRDPGVHREQPCHRHRHRGRRALGRGVRGRGRPARGLSGHGQPGRGRGNRGIKQISLREAPGMCPALRLCFATEITEVLNLGIIVTNPKEVYNI